MHDWTLNRLSPTDARVVWDGLEGAAPDNPFLSRAWFDCLVAAAGDRVAPELWQAAAPDGRESIAALHRARARRSRVIPSRVLHLNATGDPELDRLTLEHNGLVGAVAHEPEALRALVEGLLAAATDWDELALDWMTRERWDAVEAQLNGLGLEARVVDVRPHYYVDLRSLDGLEAYLAGLSRNTRYQIRRAMRGFGDGEGLRVESAEDAPRAREWFAAMVEWHQAEWNARGKSGAFASPFMRAFHECLIENGTGSGLARMLRVQGVHGPVGYLYNLGGGGYVCNYQSGFHYHEDPKLKPGLVCHALAIGQAAEQGLARYDLLMGDSQYKRSLANGQGEMLQIRLQRPRWRFRVERGLRRLLHR